MQDKHKRDCVHTKTFLHFAILAGYPQNANTALWSVVHSDEMISELPSLKTKIEVKAEVKIRLSSVKSAKAQNYLHDSRGNHYFINSLVW